MRDEGESASGDRGKKPVSGLRVKVVPGLRGVEVVRGAGAASGMVGVRVPWDRVWCTSKHVTLFDEGGERLTVDGRPLITRVVGGLALASRLKHRSVVVWATHGEEAYEIEQEPRSVRAWLFEFGFVVLLGLVFFAYLSWPVVSRLAAGTDPLSVVVSLIYLAIITPLPVVMLWLIWRQRPRSLSFERVSVTPDGMLCELGGRVRSVLWTEIEEMVVRRGSGMCQLAMVTVEGERILIECEPRELALFTVPHGLTRTRVRRAMNAEVVQGLRLIGLGVIAAAFVGFVTRSFPAWVPNGAPIPASVAWSTSLSAFGLSAFCGMMLVWMGVRKLPRVRRRLHGLRNRCPA